MYLRGTRCRWSIPKSNSYIWTGTVSRAPPFTRVYSHSGKEERQEQRLHQSSKQDNRDGHGSKGRGPIRPITLFAICIPLGYALNWILKQQNEAHEGPTADGFVKYALAKKEEVSTTGSIFTLKPATSSPIDTNDPSLARAITSIQFKQPQLQIARNYTLLPPKEGEDSSELRFFIRRERNGEVSGYLHRLPVGAEVEVRGVFTGYELPSDVGSVVFLAGGTGIAPAMQIAQILAGKTPLHVLWASRSREDCAGGISDGIKRPPDSWSLWSLWRRESVVHTSQENGAIVSELDTLKHRAESQGGSSGPAELYVDYFVDEEGTFIQPSDVQQLLQRETSRASDAQRAGKRIVFVSGPDGFINHWAAPKQWKEGREVQGRLGGILSRLDLTGWEVVKL